ncbi:DUF1810 domain-containing protein [Hymenobacter sp. HSC-4F20]|uniref:DUF1810 domain-containing protein n=1 Tax=Hymenobacter sp. HSC-4F20 TaxID=2864135 RepID=UPI001C730EB1|nr:DUF1810 domain-containing protein [Hymenobacter sp. HSC-4F20]MBX0289501.1 DUF1810 domain-containing protein [Hymenobacter sp. HSC-4F20]
MTRPNTLQRFLDAQKTAYPAALAEIKRGRKTSHWMWYIFPQIQGLGFSETSRFYGIKDRQEAEEYLQHPVLGPRLVEISQALLALPGTNATAIFGSPDDVKLKSSMTLFSCVPNADPVFEHVLDKFFHGDPDGKTLQLLLSPGTN